jgi:hypothetical protein
MRWPAAQVLPDKEADMSSPVLEEDFDVHDRELLAKARRMLDEAGSPEKMTEGIPATGSTGRPV